MKCSDLLASGTNSGNKYVAGWCNYYTGSYTANALFTTVALTAVTFSTGLAAVSANS
jgi:hypothetical protein